MGAFLLLALVGSIPPVLLDPAGASLAAISQSSTATRAETRLMLAETLFLAGRGKETLALLDRLEPGFGLRVARLQLDARLMLLEPEQARPALAQLERSPAWANHVARQTAQLELLRIRGGWSSYGMMLFALAMALLSIGASTELLRPGRELIVVALAASIGALLIAERSALLGRLAGVLFVAWLAVIHASTAARRRIAPGPRGRLVLFVLALLALIGAGIAVVAPMSPTFLAAEILLG